MSINLNTTTELVQDVRDRGSMQASLSTYSPDKIINQMSNILISKVGPQLASLQQEYLVHIKDVPWQGNDNLEYIIPERAIGVKLRDFMLLKDSPIVQWISIPNIDPANLKRPNSSMANTPPILMGYYLQDDRVILWFGQLNGVVTFSGVRFKYYRRPNQLCAVTAAGHVTAVNPGASQVTVDQVPTGFVNGTVVDIIKGTTPYISRIDGDVVSNISGLVLTLSTYPVDIAIGDWIAPTGTSPVPQIPIDWHSYLVQLTLIRVMEGLGNQKTAIYKDEAKELLQDALKTALPRVDSAPRSLANYNLLCDF